MSKSSQTERSLSELSPDTLRSAKIRESGYHLVREELRKIYNPKTRPYYWTDEWPSVCKKCGGIVDNIRGVGFACENSRNCGTALVGG